MINQKIGIITVHNNVNYGANLQAFASNKFINDLGYNCTIVDYSPKSELVNSKLFSWLLASWNNEPNKSLKRKLKLGTALLLSAPQKYRRLRNFRKFRKNYCNLSDTYKSAREIADGGFDTVVCGSDQIWNPDITNGIDPIFFGDIDGVTKRISYAASMGKAEYTPYEAQQAIPLIRELDYCSVREADSADYLEKLVTRKVETVCDPVFLLDKTEYENLVGKRLVKQDYVLVYSIVSNDKMLETAKKYAKEHNLKLVEICANKDRQQKHKQITDCGPIEFLNAFKYANTIFTNSFHGTAFSIIFGKRFYVFNNKARGSRITNLLEKSNLTEYMIDENAVALPEQDINYTNVNKKLQDYITSSKDFLTKALNAEKKPLLCNGCVGCGACKTVCAHDAIRVTKDDRGFLKSYIDTDKCKNCDLCLKVCPISTPADSNSGLEIFAFKAPDTIRKKSTSGGAFAALAETVIKMSGTVYGACLNNRFKLCHKRIDKTEDIPLLQGTKYIQSDMTNIFGFLKSDILSNRSVLFSGTPCQIAAVKNFVKRENLNDGQLYLCDIICHGVPSPKVFSDYIEWLKRNEDAEKYYFRNKSISWRGDSSALQTTDQKLKHNEKTSAFMNLYYSNNITCDACFECKFTQKERVGDITISDFWGIEKASPEFEDSLGVSMVIVNTEKCGKLFGETEGSRISSDISYAKQPQLDHPTAKPCEYDSFWNEYRKFGINYAIKNFGIPKKDLKTIIYNLVKRK